WARLGSSSRCGCYASAVESNVQSSPAKRAGGDLRMRILVLGGDGYLGWPTAMHLANRGHDVAVVDSFHRRLWDHEIGADSLIPIESLQDRVALWSSRGKKAIRPVGGDITEWEFVEDG